jgi:hypothetical protein
MMPSQLAKTKIDPGKHKNSASKQSRVVGMLRSPAGAAIAAMMQKTGWQSHSVRGFLSQQQSAGQPAPGLIVCRAKDRSGNAGSDDA